MKCGEAEKKLGQAERDLKAKSMSHFLHQLKNFLEGDMKTITVSHRLFIYMYINHRIYIFLLLIIIIINNRDL